MSDTLREFQDALLIDRVVNAAKGPTFEQARGEALDALKKDGWKVNDSLKIPHATSPDGKLRLWFKAQAVWYTFDPDPGRGKSHDFKGARSTWMNDIRKMDTQKFMSEVDRFKKWEEDQAKKSRLASDPVVARVVTVARVAEAAKK